MLHRYAAALAVIFAFISGCGEAKTRLPQTLALDGHVDSQLDWTAGCDNIGQCTAIGFPRPQAKTGLHTDTPYEMGMIYRLDAGAGNIETIEIFPSNDIIIDGLELFRIAGLPSDMGRQFRFLFNRTTLPSEAAFELTRMMKAGTEIRGINDNEGDVRVRFPGAGFAVVAAAMENHLDNFILPSNEADDRPLNKLRPIAVSRGVGHDELKAERDELRCDPDTTSIAPQKYILFGGTVLLRLQCDQLSRNAKSYWYEVDGKRDVLVPRSFPEPRDKNRAPGGDWLSNASFDPETGILQSTEFAGSDGDCGIFWRWVTTRIGWKLLDRREMPRCGSKLKPADWIRTYRSPIIDEESVL